MSWQKTTLHDRRRKFIDQLSSDVVFCSCRSRAFFADHLFYPVSGLEALSLEMLTDSRKVRDKVGGVANGILGSGSMLFLCCESESHGMAAGIYLSEYGEGGKTATILRWTIDLLTVFHRLLSDFHLWLDCCSGGFSLGLSYAFAIILLPLVARSTGVLRAIPNSVREAGLALGLPRWKVVLRILLPGNTGLHWQMMLACSRVVGGQRLSFPQPLAISSIRPLSTSPLALPLRSSALQEWLSRVGLTSLGGSLILVGFVFALNFGTRALFYFRQKEQRVL